jgi:hypothetical protein
MPQIARAQAVDLSPTEIALLELTNGSPPQENYREVYGRIRPLFTTKEAYLWAGVLAYLAEHVERAEETRFLDILSEAIHEVFAKFSTFDPMQDPQWDPFEALVRERALFTDTIKKVNLGEPDLPKMLHTCRMAYLSLNKKGLIEDPIPIVIGGVAIAVLGLIPTGFTKKTKEGEVVSERIQATFWKYEKSKVGDTITKDVQVRLWKLIKAFWSGAMGGLEESFRQTS